MEKKRKYIRTLISILDNGTTDYFLFLLCIFLYFPNMLASLCHRFFFSHSTQNLHSSSFSTNTEIIPLVNGIVFLSKHKTL